MKLKINETSLSNLLIWAAILTGLCGFAYGYSYIIYAILTLSLAALVYGIFFSHLKRKININELLLIMTLLITLPSAIRHLSQGGVKSYVMINISLLLPLAISYMDIRYQNLPEQICRAEKIVFIVMLLLTQLPGEWNSNSIGIQYFICANVGFLGIYLSRNKRQKCLAIAFLSACFFMILSTESRNTGLIMLACIVLLLLPAKWLKKRWLYRLIYLGAMAATILAPYIMDFVFSSNVLMMHLLNFTSKFSDKGWSMDSHLAIILYVKDQFMRQDVYTQVFGTGMKLHLAHNLFYQCLFSYGILGTAMIYVFYIRIFETAFKLYKYHNNKLVLACAMAMVGHFLLQCAEVYMFGIESPYILAFVPAGIILHQYRLMKESHRKKRIEKIPLI